MTAHDLNFPPDFCGEVRLFPLSELVMFPSNVLPLHIFESRYKEMLEDALSGDQLVAMATLMPGFDHDYFPAMRRLSEELSGHEIPLAVLTDVVAFHLPLKLEIKLQLLAETDPTLRAELLLANYPWTEPREGDSGWYRGDFSTN